MAKNTMSKWLQNYVNQYHEQVKNNFSFESIADIAAQKGRRDNLNKAEEIVERNTKRVRRTENHSENESLIDKERTGLDVLEGLNSDITELSSFNNVIYDRVMQSNDRISIYQIPEKVRRGVADIYLRDRLSSIELGKEEVDSDTPFSPHEVQEISAADLLPELYEDHAKRAVIDILTETDQKSPSILKRQKNTEFAKNIQIKIATVFSENEEAKKWLEENWGLYIVEIGAGAFKSYTLATMAKDKNKKNPSPIGNGRNVVEIITKVIDENGLPTDRIGKSILSIILNQPIDHTDKNSASVSTLFTDKFMEVPEGAPQINVDPVKVANTINELRRDFEYRESIYGDNVNYQVGNQENIQESARNAMTASMENMSEIYAGVLTQSILDTLSGHDDTTARQLKRIFEKDGKILIRAIKEVLPEQNLSFIEGEFDLIMPESGPIVKAIVEKLAETGKSQLEVERIADILGYKVTFDAKGNPIVEGETSPQLTDKIKSSYEKASENEMKLYDKNKEILYGAKFEEESLRNEIANEKTDKGSLIRNHQWTLYSTVALKYIDPISQEISFLEGFINGNQTFQDEMHGVKVKVAEWFKEDIKVMLEIRQEFADEAEFVRFAAQQRIEELKVIKANTTTMIAAGIEKAYEGIPGFDRATIDMMLGSEVEGLTLSSHEDILNFIATAGTPENTQYRLDMVNGIWDRIINDPNMTDEKREKLINTYEYKVGEGQPSFFVEISRDEKGNLVTHYRTQEEQTRYNNVKIGITNAIENNDSSFLTENTFTEEGINSVKRLGNGFINFRPVLQADGTYRIENVEVVPGLTEERITTWKTNNNIGPKYNIYNPNDTTTRYTTGPIIEKGDEVVLTGDDGIDVDASKGEIKVLTREEAEKGELGVINLIGGPDPEHRYCLVLPPEMVASINADLDTIATYDAQYYVDLAEKGEDEAYTTYESHKEEVNNKYNGSITNTSAALEKAYNESSDEVKADLQKSAMVGFDFIASQPVLPEDESEEGIRNRVINNRRKNVLAIAKEVLGEDVYSTIVVTSLDETGASVTTINSEVLAAKLEEKGKTDEFTLRILSAVGKSEIERHRNQKCREKIVEMNSPRVDPVLLSTTGGEDKNPTTAWKYTPVAVAGSYATKDSRRKAIDKAYEWYLGLAKRQSEYFDKLAKKEVLKMRENIKNNTYPAYDRPIFMETNDRIMDRATLDKYSDIFVLLGEDLNNEKILTAIISDPENIKEFKDPEVRNFIIKYHKNGPEFYEKLEEKGIISLTDAEKKALETKKELNSKLAAIPTTNPDGTPRSLGDLEADRKAVYMEVYGSDKMLSYEEMVAIEEAKLAGPAEEEKPRTIEEKKAYILGQAIPANRAVLEEKLNTLSEDEIDMCYTILSSDGSEIRESGMTDQQKALYNNTKLMSIIVENTKEGVLIYGASPIFDNITDKAVVNAIEPMTTISGKLGDINPENEDGTPKTEDEIEEERKAKYKEVYGEDVSSFDDIVEREREKSSSADPKPVSPGSESTREENLNKIKNSTFAINKNRVGDLFNDVSDEKMTEYAHIIEVASVGNITGYDGLKREETGKDMLNILSHKYDQNYFMDRDNMNIVISASRHGTLLYKALFLKNEELKDKHPDINRALPGYERLQQKLEKKEDKTKTDDEITQEQKKVLEEYGLDPNQPITFEEYLIKSRVEHSLINGNYEKPDIPVHEEFNQYSISELMAFIDYRYSNPGMEVPENIEEMLKDPEIRNFIVTYNKNGAQYYLEHAEQLGLVDENGKPVDEESALIMENLQQRNNYNLRVNGKILNKEQIDEIAEEELGSKEFITFDQMVENDKIAAKGGGSPVAPSDSGKSDDGMGK